MKARRLLPCNDSPVSVRLEAVDDNLLNVHVATSN